MLSLVNTSSSATTGAVMSADTTPEPGNEVLPDTTPEPGNEVLPAGSVAVAVTV
nr:hypothetical protein [Acinetobacter oleivorans]